jgi:hypothetical protein
MKRDGHLLKRCEDALLHKAFSEKTQSLFHFSPILECARRPRAVLGFSAEEQARFRACCAAFVQ